MRAYVLAPDFGLDRLSIVEQPTREPGPREVRVAIRACSLNYRDWLMVEGRYNPKQPLPLVPLSDGVGVVTAVGGDVRRFASGDRVAGNFCQGWLAGEPTREKLRATLGGPLDGMLRQEVVLPEDGWVHVPAHLSDEEAACLPCAGLTAWSALFTQGGVKAGDTVLVLGTGGVAVFALQLARLAGARVIVTSRSDEKLERARALGAHATVCTAREAQWGNAVRELTGGIGVDHVIEVGGVGTLEQSLRATRVGGHVSLIGVLAGSSSALNLTPVLMQNIRIQGVLVGSREGFEAMNRAITTSSLRPVVDRVFAFEQTREAFAALATGSHFGKLVIRVAG